MHPWTVLLPIDVNDREIDVGDVRNPKNVHSLIDFIEQDGIVMDGNDEQYMRKA